VNAVVGENRRFHSNFDFFRFVSHLKRFETGRKMSAVAILIAPLFSECYALFIHPLE
jgi:hypothetical protein